MQFFVLKLFPSLRNNFFPNFLNFRIQIFSKFFKKVEQKLSNFIKKSVIQIFNFENIDNNFFFFFYEFFEEHESEQGKWRTMETFLRELDFYIDIENGDNADFPENRLQPTKEQAEMILKVCQQKFYKIEEI